MVVASKATAQNTVVQSADLLRLRSVGDVRFSPDGSRIAYTVSNNDGPGRPYTQVWVLSVSDGKSLRFAVEQEPSSDPTWSPDGQWIAFHGRAGGRSGLVVAHPDGTGARLLAEIQSTNAPLPGTGADITWSPDSRRIAFVSAQPGPETAEASGDPMVIRRYLYKPTAGEGLSHFNDNRRLHLFVVDVASGQVQQLTNGIYYEHSIDWSPGGQEILFVSSNQADDDQFFNYDLFALRVADGTVRRLTATENAEYRPRWSPDGKTIAYLATKRGLTDRETTMEDTHVWLINADGTNRREIATLDQRQATPDWAPEGSALYFTAQEHGNVHLYRQPVAGDTAQLVLGDAGSIGSWSVARGGSIAYAYSGPSDVAQLFLRTGSGAARQLTDLNATVLARKAIAPTDSFTFVSNDNKYLVQAFLTRPINFSPDGKYPLIVVIHGGPHGQQGTAFNFKNQVYAAQGWATLMVNYRGSTGYGQDWSDLVFADQNGNEAQDVLYGLNAAMRRNLWIDRDRLGVEGTSYGGQLTNWLNTQTTVFKAAIPIAGIANLVSYNYMTYYNQYEQMEWGIFPHQGTLMDKLWERSALRYVAQAHTPTMLVHGENDNDVPIAEAEQFYVALQDVGVEAIMVRYPREGHGVRESKHVVDLIDRSVTWYKEHFPPAGRASGGSR
ncbi:MAG: hypothetical protein A2W29_02035 [Gemmatimonadetes bacterium RBG_16_66_8]|nr:MAG: hypothetical protein A2W29_02035 [Gemmatimonadetes bacterium RBG_16_66_8]